MMDNYRPWYILLSLFFLILIGAGLLTAVYLVPRQQTLRKKAAGENSRLELPNSRSVNVNDQFNLPVMLNTDGARIIGADVVIEFNPTYLQLIDFTPHPQSGSLETFLPIDGSGNFDKSQLISGAGSGRIEFGAVAYRWSTEMVLNGFNGRLGVGNPSATLRFKALQSTGNTKVYFQATPGSTTDSNLVIQSGPTDILAETTETDVSISSGPTSTPGEPTNTPPDGECLKGDADCDGAIGFLDFSAWRSAKYDAAPADNGNCSGQGSDIYGDADCNGRVEFIDFSIWRSAKYD